MQKKEPEAPAEPEVIDIGPLTKMVAEKQPEVVDPKAKDVKKKVDPLEKKRQQEALIEDRTFMSRLAEQACCSEDMLEFLSEVLDEKTTDFSIEERNLFSVAFKNFIEHDRLSLVTLSDIQDFEGF